MYRIIPQTIPQHQRAEINEKILFCIDTGRNNLSPETIYNCYTGLGGLHNLKQKDYTSYHEYSQAKKEIEMGQFFTPHEICRDMVELISPKPTETVIDMCCGMGNLFNHLPNPHNVFGFDIDPKAVAVARHLYPDATIETCDIRQYNPEQRFDIVIGNPPFNLDLDGNPSQFYYMTKAHSVLVPAGFLIMIVPGSFLQKESWEKRKVTAINRDFSFIGQMKLDSNAFASTGVCDFETKIMIFMRESSNITMQEYNAEEFLTKEELREKILAVRQIKEESRVKIGREKNLQEQDEIARFEYKLKKYLFELKTHQHLQKHYNKAIALVTKYQNQKPPEDCTNARFKEWEKKKLTPVKVLSTIRRYITRQHVVSRKEVALVKTSYGFKLKAYAPRLLDDVNYRIANTYNLVLNRCVLPRPQEITPTITGQIKGAKKIIRRKVKEFERQEQPFAEMQRNPELERYVDSLTFSNRDMETCRFTELQKRDLGLILQKRYSLLNWQQGSGKTAAIYHYGKYMLKHGKIKNVIVLAPAIATNLTWIPFLNCNKEEFYVLKSWQDFQNVPQGVFLVVSVSMIGKLKKYLSRLMKIRSQKVCLIFDESDEITNPNSQRTKAILDTFRRVKYKILATGTTTRNNINELYSQLNLLYNNSVNFMCWPETVYYEDKEHEITSESNRLHGEPFPAGNGANLFKSCFCPGRASVFGIEKQNQDIYNQEELTTIINKTIITRKFREFAGEKYTIHTQSVTPTDGEREVYKIIVTEFYRICKLYFASIKDSKKEAGLRLMRQIKLLIRACSVPHQLEGYYGDPYPSKAKAIKKLIRKIPGLVAVGCTTLNALDMYEEYLTANFPDRPVFVIKGSVSFTKRQSIIAKFQKTINGILICTQQSLKSSANIPQCDDVILEALQWNIPKMEQFYFRFIRLDSKNMTRVYYVTYEDSIEQNLMALVLTKERLNEFIKSGEVKEQSEIFDEFDISMSVIDSLLKREQDSEGKFYITWGSQRIA